MKRSPLGRFLRRFFSTGPSAEARDGRPPHRSDASAHEGFRTRRGQGPFLLSYDGRVIPLRKARFLRGR